MSEQPHFKNTKGNRKPKQALSELREIDLTLWDRLSRQDENEKKELARSLHDHVLTALSDLKIQINLALEKTGDEQTSKIQADINQSIGNILENTQIAISELRPPLLDDLGLVDTLDWYKRMISRQSGLNIHLTLSPDMPALMEPYRTDIFRLFQMFSKDLALEVQADHLHIIIRYTSEAITLDYQDDGLDIASLGQCAWDMLPLAKIRLKILSLEGHMAVKPSSAKGNEIHVSIPVRSTAPSSTSGGPE